MSELFNWETYLDLAIRLHETPSPTEADLRTAISRAYYAAYHLARQRKPDLVEPGTERNHGKFWNALIDLEGKSGELGHKGKRLMYARHAADYDNPFGISLKQRTVGLGRKAQESLHFAKILVGAYRQDTISP